MKIQANVKVFVPWHKTILVKLGQFTSSGKK